MSLDKFQQAWKAEASQLKVTFDADLLSKQVQQSHDQFRSLIFWRDVREIGVSLLLIPIWFAMGIGLSLPWSWWLTVPALIWVAGFMLIDRKRHPKTPSEPGESLLFYAKESLSQVDHQIWLLRNVFWWYLLPFTISLSAFFIHVAWNTTGTWWGAMLVAAPFGLFLYYLYRWIYRLNQQAVRQQLQPRQEHLQRIVTNLESDGGGDASEVDDLVELVSSLSCARSECWLEFGLVGLVRKLESHCPVVVDRGDDPGADVDRSLLRLPVCIRSSGSGVLSIRGRRRDSFRDHVFRPLVPHGQTIQGAAAEEGGQDAAWCSGNIRACNDSDHLGTGCRRRLFLRRYSQPPRTAQSGNGRCV